MVHAGIDGALSVLLALDAGAVRDEFQVIGGWRETDFDGWNQDQTLRSSMRHSTVWVYQQFAREIGEVREKEYLTRIHIRRPVRNVSIASGSTAPSGFQP